MDPMKQVAVVFLSVILIAGLIHGAAGRTCAAGNSTIELTPPPGSPFPSASGSVTVSCEGPFWGYTWGGRYRYFINGIQCQAWGLSPNTWYRLHRDADFAGYIVTDGNGDGGWGNASQGAKLNTRVFSVRDDATGIVVLSSK